MKRYEQRLVSGFDGKDFELEVKKLGDEGFRAVNFQVGVCNNIAKLFVLMEREVKPTD